MNVQQYSESEDEEEVNYQELIKSAYAIKKESKSRSLSDVSYIIVSNNLEKEKARLRTEFEDLQTTANLLNCKAVSEFVDCPWNLFLFLASSGRLAKY